MSKEKELGKARNNQAGWTGAGLCKLLESWGFQPRVIGKELRYEHAQFNDIKMSITKASGEISKGYVKEAIRQIDEANRRLVALSQPTKAPDAPSKGRTTSSDNSSKG